MAKIVVCEIDKTHYGLLRGGVGGGGKENLVSKTALPNWKIAQPDFSNQIETLLCQTLN